MYKVMALDVGTKRIGIAMSDYLLMIANGMYCIPREPEDEAVKHIDKLAKENNVKKIVVGLPVHMNGEQGVQARDCLWFGSKLKGDYEVIYEDERLTSSAAQDHLQMRRVNYRKDRSLIDIESARIILEQYLARKK